MDGAEIVRLLGAILGSAVFTQLLQSWFGRKRMSADTVNLIQQAAGGITKVTAEDNARLRTENARLEERNDGLEERNDLLAHALRDQNSYCWRLAEEVRRLGGTVPDPPELPDEIKHY